LGRLPRSGALESRGLGGARWRSLIAAWVALRIWSWAMAHPSMRWHKHMRGIVTSVEPGEPVHVWIDGSIAADSRVGVFQVAETAVRRAFQKLGRSPGMRITDLPLDPAARVPRGAGGVLTVDWLAAQRLTHSL